MDLKFGCGLGLECTGLGLVVCGLDYNTDTFELYNFHNYISSSAVTIFQHNDKRIFTLDR